MEKIKKLLAHKVFRVLKWVFLILIIGYFALVIYRVFYFFDQDKINAQIEKIHNTKITMDDVMGKNLPPTPGADADKTIAGIDANNNGVRDDVEIAIFKDYPNSAKTRAVLLQYALVLQMELTQPFLNTANVTEVITEESRADSCLSDTLVPRKTAESSRTYEEVSRIQKYVDFLEEKQFNTQERKDYRNKVYEYLRSYSESVKEECDIDVSKLSN